MKNIRCLPVLLALATGAFAQENNAARQTLAHEVIAAMHADKMFDGMGAQMKQMAAQMSGNALPADATPEQRKLLEDFQGKVMDLSMQSAKDMIGQMDQTYAQVYSEAELKAMKAFFVSPEGQSMLAKQPQIMQHLMPLIQAMQRDIGPKIEALANQFKKDLDATKAKPAEAAVPSKM